MHRKVPKEEARAMWARRCDLLVLASRIQNELDNIERRRAEGAREYQQNWANTTATWQASPGGRAYIQSHREKIGQLAEEGLMWQSRLRSVHDEVAAISAILTVNG
jgi:hypothetical protein